FTPCELMQEVGLAPYNVEGFSCYLTGSRAEEAFLAHPGEEGISDTLCSYHRSFLGAAEMGVLPKPRCIVYTNLICDANMLTFRRLAEEFDVPSFFIDVPYEQEERNVAYVARQLRELSKFLEEQTGRKIDPASLTERLRCSKRTLRNCRKAQAARARHFVPTDLVTPLYAGMTNNVMLGTPEEERYTKMLLDDLSTAEPARGKRIYWMHTIPFWSDAVKKEFCFSENAQIIACELAQAYDGDIDPDHPYEAMARRMVYNSFNGNATRRIENGIRHARELNCDGAIWFAHWGCKHTAGAAQLAKKKFEEAGIPLLILDGDGTDRSHGGEGQTATRIGAFLEMLN
ncbi:MAG: 2-hydroxyacyl-CoA dehydratase family protein, partial [Clostridiales bacterium]|nr:2-hydroxyacyl-CoA dehydratase family protein [Clostridiales bacterium]